MNVSELRKELANRGLPTTGKKATLAMRLLDAMKEKLIENGGHDNDEHVSSDSSSDITIRNVHQSTKLSFSAPSQLNHTANIVHNPLKHGNHQILFDDSTRMLTNSTHITESYVMQSCNSTNPIYVTSPIQTSIYNPRYNHISYDPPSTVQNMQTSINQHNIPVFSNQCTSTQSNFIDNEHRSVRPPLRNYGLPYENHVFNHNPNYNSLPTPMKITQCLQQIMYSHLKTLIIYMVHLHHQ